MLLKLFLYILNIDFINFTYKYDNIISKYLMNVVFS